MGLWRLTILVLFTDALGLASIGYLVSVLDPAWLERLAGLGRVTVALLVVGCCLAIARPIAWSYHSILALDFQATSRPRRFAGDLSRAAWFLVLPLAFAPALLARGAVARPPIGPRLAPIIGGLPEYLAWLVAVGVITFLLYGQDKFVAQRRATSPDLSSRIRESTLNWLAFLGGWPGALAAQSAFHHKTADTKFRAFFFLAVLGHVAAIALVVVLAHRMSRG